VRTRLAVLTVGFGLLGCSATEAPPKGGAPVAAAAAAPAAAVERAAGGEPGRPDLAVGASVEQTVAELRELKTSAFELALFRLEMLDVPKLKATLLERHVLRPHPQAMGAYSFAETGEVRVRLDDDWQQEVATGRPFIAVRVDFGSFEQPQTPKATDEIRQRAAAAVAYVRTGLTGSNGCEPWEITANGMSRGKCSYHLIEQRFFPHTRSGYADPMDPARMHAVANIARAFRVEATAGIRRGGKQSKWLTCAGPITADETKCELHDASVP
jgi:hypothetical protein